MILSHHDTCCNNIFTKPKGRTRFYNGQSIKPEVSLNFITCFGMVVVTLSSKSSVGVKQLYSLIERNYEIFKLQHIFPLILETNHATRLSLFFRILNTCFETSGWIETFLVAFASFYNFSLLLAKNNIED